MNEQANDRAPPLPGALEYPFTPKSNTYLAAGQFWAIPLRDGRFGCGRVLAVVRSGPGSRSTFLAGVLDWVDRDPPTAETIAGASLLEAGNARIDAINRGGGCLLGMRPLESDGLVPPANVRTYWSPAYPRLRAERRFIDGEPPPRWERRTVRSPLSDEMLCPSETGQGVVQFNRPLKDNDFRLLSGWLAHYPRMTLRAYASSQIRDLEFLRFFPTLRRFECDGLYELESAAGLRHLPDNLDALGLGATQRKLDLALLARFHGLKQLYLEAQTKNIQVISELVALEELTLRSVTLPDLSLLLPLNGLLAFQLKLGGSKDLSLLPRIGRLRYLELWLVRGLADLSMLGRLPHLRSLFLQALKNVETLPDLSENQALRRVHLETMKNIHDLRPLATAPALEQLLLIDMPQLQPESLRPLIGLPTLKAVTVGMGSVRKNTAARTLLPLPEIQDPLDWRND